MRKSDWSWTARISFVLIGVFVGMWSMMALADDGCSQVGLPGAIEPQYWGDNQGHTGPLHQIRKVADNQLITFMFDGTGNLTDLNVADIIGQRGDRELTRPKYAIEYDPKSGRMTSFATYELANFAANGYPRGPQTKLMIPANVDLEALRDPATGMIKLSGQPMYCPLMDECSYDSPAAKRALRKEKDPAKMENLRKALNPAHTVEFSEPSNVKGIGCYTVGGIAIDLKNGHAKKPLAADSPTVTPNQDAKNVPAPQPADDGSVHEYKIPGGDKYCIGNQCVYSHDDGEPDSAEDAIESAQ